MGTTAIDTATGSEDRQDQGQGQDPVQVHKRTQKQGHEREQKVSWLPIAEIAKRVQSGHLKATDLVEQSLRVIAEKTEYHAVLWTLEERARERAAAIDRAITNGETVGALAGVPFIAKDNFLVFGAQTTAASNILKGFDAPYQATVINRLEEQGAICVAKANLDAFAHGGTTENSDFGPTKNPHDPERIPGGSSGGSAAAVVLQLAPFALGTDTGGSIRQPASMSGCVGFKPTYGLVSRSGVVAMASSLDTIGPLTRTVEDAATVLDVIAGMDPLDSTTIERAPESYTHLTGVLKGKRIGVIQEYMGDKSDGSGKSSGKGLQPEVKHVLEAALEKMRAAGAIIEPVSIPSLPLALAVYYILCPAEISSNLSRYDGQRYGYSYSDATDLHESYAKTRDRGFGKEAKRRIMIGTYVLSSGYYDAYYRQAQTVRTKLINEFTAAFENFDFLYGPVAPSTAYKLGEKVSDPLQMYLEDIMTVAANLVGIPALSLPAGVARVDGGSGSSAVGAAVGADGNVGSSGRSGGSAGSELPADRAYTADEDDDKGHATGGLPVGLQLMAPQRHDAELLTTAKLIEELLGSTVGENK